MASVCLLLEESCCLVISPHLYRAWYCPKERKNHGKVHIFLWNTSILIFRPCKKIYFVCMGLRFQIRLQQEGQASRERLTRKWRMLSYPLSHASRARVYPSDYVFLLSHLSHEGKKEMEKGKKWGAEDSEKRVFWELTTSRTRTVTDIVCQTPPNTRCNRMNYSWLHQTVTDVTVKNIKLLSIRVCARTWGR